MDSKVTGDKKLMRELRRYERTAPEALGAAIYEEIADIFAKSQEEVPVDTGRLITSGVAELEHHGNEYVGIIAYGTEYALAVHESEEQQVRREQRQGEALEGAGEEASAFDVDAQGKWHFLSDPFDEAMPGMGVRLAMRTQRNIKRGVVSTRGLKRLRGKKRR